MSAPDACQHEVFCASYALRKTSQDTHFFVPQSGYEKLIVNMVDNDLCMYNTVVWVSGPWKAESE